MYQKISIDEFQTKIKTELFLGHERLVKTFYENNFYLHISELVKHYLLNKSTNDEIKLNKAVLDGLDAFVLEKNSVNEVDWNFVLDAKDILETEIKLKLGKEGDSITLKPFINNTLDNFEKELVFQYSSTLTVNPWTATNNILIKNGCLYLITDEEAVFKEYNSRIIENRKPEELNNIGILAANNKKVKKYEKNEFSGLIIDNRYSTQNIVFDYLNLSAKGKNNQKTLKEIQEYLRNLKRYVDDNILKGNILLPLKRQGLIGSLQGYFAICSEDDLKTTFDSHLEKMQGIYKTLEIYAERGEIYNNNQLKKNLNDFKKFNFK